MKTILRIVWLTAAVLLILQNPGLAAPTYYIGADSKAALEQAREADPNNYAVNYFLGQIYLAEGNRDAAINAWGAYLAGAPDDGRSTAVRERMTLLKLAQAREFARKAAAQGGAPEAELPANTIAVTDFKNLGPARLVPFIKGLTAMIISDLAKVPQVRVLERAKIQALMQEMQLGLASGIVDADSAPKLGKMVQARKVAWGKMDAPDGGNLKITSIVTEIMENTNLQETDAEGAMNQFFELQKKLVFGILQGMGIDRADLPDNVRRAVEKVHTKSVDALIQFGMGVDLLDNKNFAQAKAAFAKATRIDPGFDLAGEAETATPISDVPVTSDGATEEVSMSTAGSGETGDEETTDEGAADQGTTEEGTADSGTGTTDEGTADSGTTDEGTGDDVYLADTGDTTPSTAETVATDTTTVTDTTTDTSQTTTAEDTQTPSGGWSGTGFGVFMVDYWLGAGSKAFADTYRTTTPQSGSSTSISATSYDTSDSATVNGPNETITAMSVNFGTAITGGLPYQMKTEAIGNDSYMEWGKFNVYDPSSTPPMVEGSYNHSVDSLGYYVGGDLTVLSQISTLAGQSKSASYSGTAYGTIWTPTGGVDMTGDLTMDVDFHVATISNFDWLVYEGGASDPNKGYAYVSGGSGSFDPYTTTTYTVTSASWGMDPNGSATPSDGDSGTGTIPGDVRGTFYGTDAMKTGGIVLMQGTNNNVNGNYEATRGALTP